MAQLHALSPDSLERYVHRSKASSSLPEAPDLSRLLGQILMKASELVPSESGALLLDDPLAKVPDPTRNTLHFVAAFGTGANGLLGQSVPAGQGVAGHVYATGKAHLGGQVEEGATVPAELAARTGATAHSIIAAPVQIGDAVCGAIELMNRRDGEPYSEHDLVVLEVFASYTASSIQNALDARNAHELAKMDDLTGLFNDRYLHVRLRDELDRIEGTDESCAMLFLDLDHFKPVNDTYGHLVGSQVLREIGYLLRRVTVEDDAFIARYGGDEFTMVLPGRTATEASAVAERIREAVETAVFLPRARGTDLPALHLHGLVTVSIGVAAVDGHEGTQGDAASGLIRRSDEAMYEAKAEGRNRVMVAGMGRAGEAPLGKAAGGALGSGA